MRDEDVLRYAPYYPAFRYTHLPTPLREIGKPFHDLARFLLQAKVAAVCSVVLAGDHDKAKMDVRMNAALDADDGEPGEAA